MIWTMIALVTVVALAFLIYVGASMTITHTWAITETGEGAGIGSNVSASFTGTDVISYSGVVPKNTPTTDLEVDLPFATANLQALIITTTVNVTMYVNAAHSGSPTDTISLKAGTPWVWEKNSGITCPITGTAGVVTKLFFVNADVTTDANVRIRGIQAL